MDLVHWQTTSSNAHLVKCIRCVLIIGGLGSVLICLSAGTDLYPIILIGLY